MHTHSLTRSARKRNVDASCVAFFAAACAVACTLSSAVVSAQSEADLDTRWNDYAEQSERFIELQTQCDDGDIRGTTTNRICRRAVDQGFELANTIGVLVEEDTALSDDDRAALIDGMLTTRQISASIMVDLGECEAAKPHLQALLVHPEIADRPSVAEAAQRWIDNADVCIAEQQALAEQAAQPDEAGQPPAAAERNMAPVLVAAGGGALVASGAILDIANQSSLRTLRGVRDDGEACLDRCETALNRVENTRVPIALLYGIGGATLVGGVVWMIVDGNKARDSDVAWQVLPHASFDAGEAFYGVSLGRRF